MDKNITLFSSSYGQPYRFKSFRPDQLILRKGFRLNLPSSLPFFSLCIISAMKSILFGQYLLKKGYITWEDILRARIYQKRHDRKTEELAIEHGWLSAEDVEKLAVRQEETCQTFNEIAAEWGLLTKSQIETLLKEKADNHILFGAVLVQLDLISNEDLEKNIEEFQELKLKTFKLPEV